MKFEDVKIGQRVIRTGPSREILTTGRIVTITKIIPLYIVDGKHYHGQIKVNSLPYSFLPDH